MKIVTACREEFGPARPLKDMLEHDILAASEQKLVSEDGIVNVLYSDPGPMLSEQDAGGGGHVALESNRTREEDREADRTPMVFHRHCAHRIDRYSCADVVQIRRSVMYPTAHSSGCSRREHTTTPSRVRILRQQCYMEIIVVHLAAHTSVHVARQILWRSHSRPECQGPQRKYAGYLSTTQRKLKMSGSRNSKVIREMMRKEMK